MLKLVVNGKLREDITRVFKEPSKKLSQMFLNLDDEYKLMELLFAWAVSYSAIARSLLDSLSDEEAKNLAQQLVEAAWNDVSENFEPEESGDESTGNTDESDGGTGSAGNDRSSVH
jgi:phenylalanyl-tRNA synthetase beta subunit